MTRGSAVAGPWGAASDVLPRMSERGGGGRRWGYAQVLAFCALRQGFAAACQNSNNYQNPRHMSALFRELILND